MNCCYKIDAIFINLRTALVQLDAAYQRLLELKPVVSETHPAHRGCGDMHAIRATLERLARDLREVKDD